MAFIGIFIFLMIFLFLLCVLGGSFVLGLIGTILTGRKKRKGEHYSKVWRVISLILLIGSSVISSLIILGCILNAISENKYPENYVECERIEYNSDMDSFTVNDSKYVYLDFIIDTLPKNTTAIYSYEPAGLWNRNDYKNVLLYVNDSGYKLYFFNADYGYSAYVLESEYSQIKNYYLETSNTVDFHYSAWNKKTIQDKDFFDFLLNIENKEKEENKSYIGAYYSYSLSITSNDGVFHFGNATLSRSEALDRIIYEIDDYSDEPKQYVATEEDSVFLKEKLDLFNK